MSNTHDEKYIQRTVKARKDAGLTQKEMATKLNVERSSYTKYENHRTLPQKYQIAFCKITNINIEWLITGNGDMKATGEADGTVDINSFFDQVGATWDEFHEENKEELLNFAKGVIKLQRQKDKLK